MQKTEVLPFVLKQGARTLAVLVFIYLLNAFGQTGYVTVTQAAVGLLWLSLCYILSQRLSIIAILALTFSLSLFWGLIIESVPVSDYLIYHNYSVLLSKGHFLELFRTKSSPTIAYYALFHWVLGMGYVTNYIASVVAWTGGAALVYKALRSLVSNESTAKFIGCGLALCPAFVVFSPVISSEAVFFLLSAVCAWLISRHLNGSGPYPYLYVAMGLVTAALFLTRANGVLALVVCLFVIGAGNVVLLRRADLSPNAPNLLRFRQPLALCAIVLTGFISVWFAHGYLSWSSGYGFQATASPWGSIYFLFGTNFQTEGRYNLQDLELTGFQGGDVPSADNNRRARKIAIERITSSPIRFIRFALSDKVRQLWGTEYNLYSGAVGDAKRKEELKPRIQSPVLAVLDGVYRFTFFLFLILLIKEIRRPSHALALGVIVFLLSLPHLFLEVRPRYHLAMTPFIVVGSLLLVHDLWSRRAETYTWIRLTMQGWKR